MRGMKYCEQQSCRTNPFFPEEKTLMQKLKEESTRPGMDNFFLHRAGLIASKMKRLNKNLKEEQTILVKISIIRLVQK